MLTAYKATRAGKEIGLGALPARLANERSRAVMRIGRDLPIAGAMLGGALILIQLVVTLLEIGAH